MGKSLFNGCIVRENHGTPDDIDPEELKPTPPEEVDDLLNSVDPVELTGEEIQRIANRTRSKVRWHEFSEKAPDN